VSAVKRVEFVSGRVSYIVLRGRWCDIVLNVHVPLRVKVMIQKTVLRGIRTDFFIIILSNI